MLERRVVHLLSDAELYDDAVQMAFLAKHTLADCMYLEAARRLGAPVITADKPMRDRGLRAYKNIKLLGEAEKH
jgi:predicted nucleic acid-binding protein